MIFTNKKVCIPIGNENYNIRSGTAENGGIAVLVKVINDEKGRTKLFGQAFDSYTPKIEAVPETSAIEAVPEKFGNEIGWYRLAPITDEVTLLEAHNIVAALIKQHNPDVEITIKFKDTLKTI